MELLWQRIKILLPLLAGVYLGFYVFAVVLGVFAPTELPVLTIIAALCVLALVAYVIARRHGIDPIPPESPMARSARHDRETRGF